MNRENIRTAINSMVTYWKNEGDTDSVSELRSDAFHHLRWLMERMSFADAFERMAGRTLTPVN